MDVSYRESHSTGSIANGFLAEECLNFWRTPILQIEAKQIKAYLCLSDTYMVLREHSYQKYYGSKFT